MGASSLPIIPPDARRLRRFQRRFSPRQRPRPGPPVRITKSKHQRRRVQYRNKDSRLHPVQEELKKKTLKCLHLLKGLKNKPIAPSDISPVDDNLTVVVDVLREVRATMICTVESLLSLFSIPWLEKRYGKGSIGLKLIRSRCKDFNVVSDELAVQSANKRLEAVEITIEDLVVELDCMFRQLIQTMFFAS